MSSHIRFATEADSPALFLLAQEYLPWCPWIDRLDEDSVVQTIQNFLTNPCSCILVATDSEQQVQGMLAALCASAFFDRAFLLAQEIIWYVRPGVQRLGYGYALYQEFTAWARTQGAHAISVATLAGGMPSIPAFLVKEGFQMTETAYLRRL